MGAGRFISNFLNLRAGLYVVAVLLALFGASNAFVAIFMPSKFQVVYQFDPAGPYCDSGRCYFSATLQVANVGRKTQEEVTARLVSLPPKAESTYGILNLNSAAPRASDPVVEQQWEGGRLTLRLKQFTPGTLVHFRIWGGYAENILPASDGQAANVTVTARGLVIEGDPRSIALGRWLNFN